MDPVSVGGYVVESVLGAGGTGTVYLANNAGRLVALKVSTSGAPPALVHSNIVPVYDHGATPDGKRWLAMEYVADGDADSELRAGRMSPDRAAHIIAGVARALDFAHAHGVVHGDVKPSNFLLDGDRVLLADFGAAPFAADGMVLASAAYASPEMLRGNEVDGRADVYSLGCSLFRLLTGKPPFFDAGSKDDVVQAHLHREPPGATEFAPWLPQAIDDVIATAMAKDPAERYPSAGELARAASAALRVKD
ncbi:serine/threonine-protein kinase [Mycolicibacterium psychrotolerans]|uniref:serine/threonine-protein kinase n=1 Tax=Mycolicibacterium psychrotolerans TaxID=216929 RepID=UPI003D6651EE